ncbi:MAG: hypothetical protein U9N44_03525 [Chloroflexota bacterium]|nr:hypothetical protein [Chloroflexota bacterium]
MIRKRLLVLGFILALVVSAAAPAMAGDGQAEASLWGRPEIGCDTDALNFTVMKGDVKTRVVEVSIWNAGDSGLLWFARDDQLWVKLSPSWGYTVNNPDEMTVRVEVADLDLGTHEAVITIAGSRATNSPVQIPVVVEVVLPRTMGPALAGLPTENLGQPLAIDPDGGTLNYVGLTAYLINGPEKYHCPIFDLLQIDLVGTWEMELDYGALTSGGSEGYSYDYCPITGGSIASTVGDIKQYWSIETVGQSEGVHYPDGIRAEGEIVGGKLINWCSVSPEVPGGGTNNWLVTIFVETGDMDNNGDDPGDVTYKCWLVDQLTEWIEGIAYNLQDMSFDPALWEEPEEGTLTALLAELPALQDLIGRFLTLDDEAVTITLGPLVDALRPLMPQIPDLLPTLLPIAESMITAIVPSTPPVLIMQPALTPCPIIEFTFGNGDPYRY